MGGAQIKDQVSSHSPWNTQIVIDNQVTTPVKVFLARNPDEPSVDDAVQHSVPPQQIFAINSGWLREPRATLLVRVGVHEAKVFRMSHAAHLKFELAPTGLKVSSNDDIVVEDFPDPGAVPNNDTVPMVLKGESFLDRKPEAEGPRSSVAREAISSASTAPPIVGPEATVHGKATEAEVATQGIDVAIDDDGGIDLDLGDDNGGAARESGSPAPAARGLQASESTPSQTPVKKTTSPLMQLAAAAVADTEARSAGTSPSSPPDSLGQGAGGDSPPLPRVKEAITFNGSTSPSKE